MIKSMTGYGIDQFHVEETLITIEIRTVNNRYLDIVSKIPRSFMYLENEMKQVIQSYFDRGRVELFLTLSGEYITDKKLTVDWNLMDQYFSELKTIKERYSLDGSIPIEMVSQLKDLFVVHKTNEKITTLDDKIIESIKRTCEQVNSNRVNDGAYLIADIQNRIIDITHMLKELETLQPKVSIDYRKRVERRIEEYVGSRLTLDDSQLHQEIAILAEKGDITEELIRMFSHLEQFQVIIDEAGPLGRRLDFIAQEMHREVNTIGAKSIDSKISNLIVNIKNELEKIREQIQNIE
ncbi:MAG TPA: YicC/YloC family endoribonuclease [Pseudogracilibacillus sp.]|nr:YicC/YloC family endoribonuclease [Pseudogracilibacillus sp.]